MDKNCKCIRKELSTLKYNERHKEREYKAVIKNQKPEPEDRARILRKGITGWKENKEDLIYTGKLWSKGRIIVLVTREAKERRGKDCWKNKKREEGNNFMSLCITLCT